MDNQERKSHRLSYLCSIALKGKKIRDLERVCDQWGLTESAKRNYLKIVAARLRKRV